MRPSNYFIGLRCGKVTHASECGSDAQPAQYGIALAPVGTMATPSGQSAASQRWQSGSQRTRAEACAGGAVAQRPAPAASCRQSEPPSAWWHTEARDWSATPPSAPKSRSHSSAWHGVAADASRHFSSAHRPARSRGALQSGVRSQARSAPAQSSPRRSGRSAVASSASSASPKRAGGPHTLSTSAQRRAPGPYADRPGGDALAPGPPSQPVRWPPASPA
jgi:hypothetical protein